MDKYKKESGLIDSSEGLNKLLFEVMPLDKKPIELSFISEEVSSDGGLLLLREVENQIGIISALTDCIDDTRHPGYIQHTVGSMLTRRIFQIAAGYEDANDSDTHGAQQLALYNDYYGEYCYMPLHIYEGFSGKLVATLLKPGRRSKTLNSLANITIESAKKQFIQTGLAVKRYHSFYYAAGSWQKPHRVIVKSDKMSCSSFAANQF